MADEVLTEVRGRTLLVLLNRPAARNAIDTPLADGLRAAMERLDADPDLAVGVIAGAGRGFCAGMDLKAFAEAGPPRGFQQLLRRPSRKPLVAAVEGFALAGGLDLALACDVLVASSGARLGIPEAAVGLLAVGGALIRLGRHLPHGRVVLMALTGEPITAEEAHAQGLVTELVPEGQAVEAALRLADRIAASAPLAVAATIEILRAAKGLTEAELWDLQHPLGRVVFSSRDAREGARAFAEKRPPSWTGT